MHFWATSEKFLGFVVNKKGVEIDLDNVRAIQDLPPLRTEKEVRSFMGRLNYIASYISQMTAKCDSIFKMLRKHNSDKWDEECQVAFDKVKEYLTNALVLVPPVPGKPLILYLTVHERSMDAFWGSMMKPDVKSRPYTI